MALSACPDEACSPPPFRTRGEKCRLPPRTTEADSVSLDKRKAIGYRSGFTL